MEQVIHSRYEFPIGNTPSDVIFETYRDICMHIPDDKGVQIDGICVAIRNSSPRSAIFLTYSSEADVFLKLRLYGTKNLDYRKLV